MTRRRLRILVAITETRTFSAAVQLVHVTHAAVSQQMQALEAPQRILWLAHRENQAKSQPLDELFRVLIGGVQARSHP